MRRSILPAYDGAVLSKFFADRGTHLAAMIAYFALLSFVPLLFLSLSLLGLATRPTRTRSSSASSSDVPEHVGRLDPARGPRDPGERDGARACRRRVPALVVALALLRARERVQHRLRPAEPRLPARQGARDADDGRLARRALRGARDRVDRRGAAEALRRLQRQRDVSPRSSRSPSRSSASSSSSPTAYYVLTNVDLTLARGAARRDRRGGHRSRRRSSSCRVRGVSKHNPVLQSLSCPAVLLVWLY